MKEPRITVDEWQKEIERVMGRSSDKGLTARELSKKFRVSSRTMRERLKVLHEAGRLGVGRRQVFSIDGRPGECPVYWIKAQNGEGRNHRGRTK